MEITQHGEGAARGPLGPYSLQHTRAQALSLAGWPAGQLCISVVPSCFYELDNQWVESSKRLIDDKPKTRGNATRESCH